MNENAHKNLKSFIRKAILHRFFGKIKKTYAGAGMPLETLEAQRIDLLLAYGHNYPSGNVSYDAWMKWVPPAVRENPDLQLTLDRACRSPQTYRVTAGAIVIGDFSYVADGLSRYEGKKLTVYPHCLRTEEVIEAKAGAGERFKIRIAPWHFAGGKRLAFGDASGAASIFRAHVAPNQPVNPENPAPPVSLPAWDSDTPPTYDLTTSPWKPRSASFTLQ